MRRMFRAGLLAACLPVLATAAGGPRELSGAYTASAGSGAGGANGAKSLAGTAPACAPAFVAGVGASSVAHLVMGRDTLVIVHEANHIARRVRIGAQHPAKLQPSALGHSIGWWEGDTLVIETVGLHSGMTVVERLRKVNEGRTLEVIVNGRAARAERRPELRYVERVCELEPAPATAVVPPSSAVATEPAAAPVTSAAAAEHPHFDGVWQITRPVRQLRTVEGRAPPLRTEARRLYEGREALYAEGRAAEYNGSDACVPPGEPRTPHGGQLFEIVQGEDAIYFGYTWNRMLRIAYFGDAAPARLPPSFQGSWSGHWDGDALVLEGSGFRADTLLDAEGLPHSAALTLTQRLILHRGGRTLEIRTTVDDPATYTRAWSTVQQYALRKDASVEEHVCVPRPSVTPPPADPATPAAPAVPAAATTQGVSHG